MLYAKPKAQSAKPLKHLLSQAEDVSMMMFIHLPTERCSVSNELHQRHTMLRSTVKPMQNMLASVNHFSIVSISFQVPVIDSAQRNPLMRPFPEPARRQAS